MKKTILWALALSAASCAFAQNFTTQPGYVATKLFDTPANLSISGLGVDAAGNVFYLQGGPSDDTRLFERAAGDFSTPIELFSYGSNYFGSFVEVIGSTVYFGETHGSFSNPLGSISSLAIGGTATQISAVKGNYDLAFSGTTAFTSAYTTGTSNIVAALNLLNGQLTPVLDTGGDYSGPIAFDAAGNLLYGTTAYGPTSPPGVFRFSKALVDQALASGTALTMASGTRVLTDDGNQYFGYRNDSTMFIANSSSNGAISLFNLTTGTSTAVGNTDAFQFFGGLGVNGSALYVAVTDGFPGTSSVYRVTAVPEPSAFGFAAMAIGGVYFTLVRRR